MRIDLHTHSNVSDGTETPAEVMRAAAAADLDVVALTDHDSMDGWREAANEASALGIEFVPGVEVSCQNHGLSIHLLAYWPDPADQSFVRMLEPTRDARVSRAREIVDRLSADTGLTWDHVALQAADATTVGRPHIADALVALGVVADRNAAFLHFLSDASPYYVPHYAPDVIDAVRTVVAAGGVPVFAHPGADQRGRIVTTSVIEAMADAGLVGLEIDHRDHDESQRRRLGMIADRLGLVRTGASDYHGTGKDNLLGENLTSMVSFVALRDRRGTAA